MEENKNSSTDQMVIRPQSKAEFQAVHNALTAGRYVAVEALKPGVVRTLTLGGDDPSLNKASDLASSFVKGSWASGPLAFVAWSFDDRAEDSVVAVEGKDNQPMGLGYVKWGPGNCTPSTIPVLAQASPYTAAPLRYIADLTSGLGPCLMYYFPDGKAVEFREAGEILRKKVRELEKQEPEYVGTDLVTVLKDGEKPEGQELTEAREALTAWEKTWYGFEETDELGIESHIPGAKEFIEENNLNLHLSQCMQDNVMLDIYFPTVGFNTRGNRKSWRPRVTRVGFLEAPIVRIEKRNEYNYSNHVYVSEQWRMLGAAQTKTVTAAGSDNIVMYPSAMPQNLLSDLRYIVKSGQRTRIKERPMWVVCPTFYPSLNKPYYPQPAWWSVFTSKAYDFSSTILYDKAKQRENRTSWGRILYISLDYLEQVFADEGYAGNKDKQDKFIENLETSMENFLQHRENQGKFMRQWMWTDQKGDEHFNVRIVDVADAVKDEVTAGKEELELSTSPIFLALQVDPRLVGVPMVAASNGGTALREMHLLKQQQQNVHQRLYLNWLQNVTVVFNGWDEHARWVIKQQTLTTLDNSKTGTVETVAGDKA